MTIDIPALLQLAKEAREKVTTPWSHPWRGPLLPGPQALDLCDAVETLAGECERLSAWNSACEEIERDAIETNKRAEKAEARIAALREALEEIGGGTAEAGGDQHVLARAARRTLATCDAEADKLRERLKAAEAVCVSVECAFAGPTGAFMYLPDQRIEIKQLGDSYEAWRRACEDKT